MIKIEIIGNLGADAEIKEVNGEKYIVFRVAHTDTHKDQQGNVIENTIWVSAIKRDRGTRLISFLTRGTRVFLRGNLSTRIYTGHDGQKHAGLSVSVDEVEFMGGGAKQQDQQAKPSSTQNDDDKPF